MKWYPWLNAPYRQLLAPFLQGKGHHALLLHAQHGSGDASLSYALSRWLMCRQPDGSKSCGQCHSCRLMVAGNHPDYYQPEPEKGRLSLGVDSVRQIIDSLYGHAHQGGAKVVWLASSELLTEPAANALLKTLEEPPENTYFLLGCREPSRLLATLRSRCWYWHLALPDEATGQAWLLAQGAGDPQMAQTALRLSGGAPVAALALMAPGRWSQRQALCDGLQQALSSGDFLAIQPLLHQERDDEPLHWLLSLLTDALKWQQGATHWLVNADRPELVAGLAGRYPALVLHQQLHLWLNCREQWLSVAGVNRELLLTQQLLNWEQGATSGRPATWTL